MFPTISRSVELLAKGESTLMVHTARVPRFRGSGVIEFADHEYPSADEGRLLVAVGANAICGTDRHEFYDGSPIVPGHEAAGVVLEAGPGTTVRPGTRGAVYLMDFCGSCRSCRLGATNQCLAKRGDIGQTTDGGYGPYLLTHETNFFPIDDETTLAEATMLLDVMGTSGHAIGRARLLRPDIESVYIAGAGPIGLGLLVQAKIIFGSEIPIAIADVSPWRLEFAESFGATAVDARDADAVRALAPDVAFDSSGKQSCAGTRVVRPVQARFADLRRPRRDGDHRRLAGPDRPRAGRRRQ